jgi:uncharacterized spore protein YtfJ
MAELTDVISGIDRGQQQGLQTMDRIFSAANARAVFGEPVQHGDYTVIVASEVMAGGGFGFGRGIGPGLRAAAAPEGAAQSAAMAGGGGGGGGGGSTGRPVATIVIGPEGVTVRPIVDVTKIAITALTAWAAMVPVLARIRRARRA